MRRMLFEKTGKAIWMSHLDTMRLMQRAFRRAGVLLHHSQGFTPHAYVSMILPLSVGMESKCEIMEYELDTDISITPHEMNEVLPEGIRILEVYESDRKNKDLAFLQAKLMLQYDRQLPPIEAIKNLLAQESLVVEKKTKRGIEETDIRPFVKECSVMPTNQAIEICCTVSAMNPSLNPLLIAAAIERYLPECKPDFVKCCRLALLDAQGNAFR